MQTPRALPAAAGLLISAAAAAQPYDFSGAEAVLNAELPRMGGAVAVILRQDGRDLYRYQRGAIGYGTRVHLASFTKTLSAAVVLAGVDRGELALTERLGDVLPFFEASGIGDPTVLDCFGMRHGIQTPIAYERDDRFTLAQSVTRIGLTGSLVFPPGTMLGYDGSGMQSVGRLAELRAGIPWESLARARLFDPCGMPDADYLEFTPNPAIAGGARSSAEETIRFAEMVLAGGVSGGTRVLSPASVERLFTNATLGLPVYGSPWPAEHPLYPYGVDPDYGFGGWILAQNPATGHVEEMVGAGAWGSFIWFDRRRGMTAVLIADVPAGSQDSLDAALGLFAVARGQADTHQASGLRADPAGGGIALSWSPAAGSTATRIVASDRPIRNIFELRAAREVARTSGAAALAPYAPHYAAIAVFGPHENPALTPGDNTISAACPADFNADGFLDFFDYDDYIACFEAGSCPVGRTADFNGDGFADFFDYDAFVSAFESGC